MLQAMLNYKNQLHPKTESAVIWMILLLAAFYINYLIYKYTAFVYGLAPDTFGYLAFSLHRTYGYGLLNTMIVNLFGDLRVMVPFQLNLLLVSYIALGHAVGRLLNSRAVALILTLLLFSISPLLQRATLILTEATFTAFMCFHFAAIALYLKKHSVKYAIGAGLALAITILIRPAGLPFFGGIILLLFLLPKQSKLTLVALGSPVVLGILASFTFNFYKHGVFTFTTFTGHQIMVPAAQVMRADDGKGTKYENVIRDMVMNYIEPQRAKWINLPYPHDYWYNTQASYAILRDSGYFSPIQQYIIDEGFIHGTNEFADRFSSVAVDVALIAITSHPILYTRHVLAHYYGGWQGLFLLYGRLSSFLPSWHAAHHKGQGLLLVVHDRVETYGKFIDLAIFNDETIKKLQEQNRELTALDGIWFLQTVTKPRLLFFLFSLFAMGFIFLNKSEPTYAFLFYAAVLFHAYFFFIATVGVGFIPRFSLPLTPLLYSFSFIVIFLVAKYIYPRLTQSFPVLLKLGFFLLFFLLGLALLFLDFVLGLIISLF